MKACVVTFPGSNCDRDIGFVLERHYGFEVNYLWHKDSHEHSYDLVVLPGGFSFGDYLRSGAMARFSKAMEYTVIPHAKKGGMLLGICNGFQILTESGLLPGALTRNNNLKFVCKDVSLKSGKDHPLTGEINQSLMIPVAHAEGSYFADSDTLKELNDENRILFRYEGDNPNGSLENIAGISSKNARIAGLMPHPERAFNETLKNMDGKIFFDRLFAKL